MAKEPNDPDSDSEDEGVLPRSDVASATACFALAWDPLSGFWCHVLAGLRCRATASAWQIVHFAAWLDVSRASALISATATKAYHNGCFGHLSHLAVCYAQDFVTSTRGISIPVQKHLPYSPAFQKSAPGSTSSHRPILHQQSYRASNSFLGETGSCHKAC